VHYVENITSNALIN